MTIAFVYASDYQLTKNRGYTIEQALAHGYMVWADVRDTHTEEVEGMKIRCLN